MRKQRVALLIVLSLCVLFACQKEKSRENSNNQSTGTLTSEVSGDCLPKTVTGIYIAGTALQPDSNYIEVQVDVATVGAYAISTDTINGITFKAKGVFGTTGLTSIKLKGEGTALNPGITTFTISFSGTSCTVAVSILPAGSSTEAEFTLLGAPATCTDFIVAGDYVVGIANTSLNTVELTINVTTIGGYNISTVVSNGFSFSGVGTLAELGEQTITLTAEGTPDNADVANFPVTVGTTTCSFSVNVLATPPLNDYFPLSTGSNWSYESDGVADDSFVVRVTPGFLNVVGQDFSVFMVSEDESGGVLDTLHTNRKSGSDYYRYTNLAKYFPGAAATYVEYLFLKDDQSTGYSWTTGETDLVISGQPFSVRLKYTIFQKGVPVNIETSNGQLTYQSVIAVDQSYEVKNAGGDWVDFPGIGFRDFYARGTGWIMQQEFAAGSPTIVSSIKLRRSVVVNP